MPPLLTYSPVRKALKYLICAILLLIGRVPDCDECDKTTTVAPITETIPIIEKADWGARPTKSIPIEMDEVPVPFVIMHDIPTVGYCDSIDDCMQVMRELQENHQDSLGWNDIDYSFVIGKDGYVMEGRGWDTMTEGTPGYSGRSLEIAVIGSFDSNIPNDGIINAVKDLINYGIYLGKISTNYTLVGHRQLANNKCPGEAFFQLIQSWPHWRHPEETTTMQTTPDLGCDSCFTTQNTYTEKIAVIHKNDWGARPPKSIPKRMTEVPVPFVIIHDIPTVGYCDSIDECMKVMREVQKDHQDNYGWNDIDYSFVIGKNGYIMEGRGWDAMTESTPGYFGRSLEIAVIGSFDYNIPNDGMINAVKDLINYGIYLGKISTDYTLVGHRQLANNKCPGEAFFNLIQSWPHWRHPEDATTLWPMPDIGCDECQNSSVTEANSNLPIISRTDWRARPPKSIPKRMTVVPVPFVIIHDIPLFGYCNFAEECMDTMRKIQMKHQGKFEWDDIKYSFVIGNDGLIMEGRGWDTMTDNNPGNYGGFLEFALLGNFNDDIPNDGMINALKKLIDFGIHRGKISANYTLLGHRQLTDDKCPGDALFELIKAWPHWGHIDYSVVIRPGTEIDCDDCNKPARKISDTKYKIIPRSDWGARPSKSPPKRLNEVPVPFVIIHATAAYGYCNSLSCKELMKNMQIDHQDNNGWNDIDYSFVIGNDGVILEGRGWDTMTEKFPGYSGRSLGIALIGYFKYNIPNDDMINALQGLINYGVVLEKISGSYTLLGHRQLTNNRCPGEALFKLIQSWPHWALADGDVSTVSGVEIEDTLVDIPFYEIVQWREHISASHTEQMEEIPVQFVIIHETGIHKSCDSMANCKEMMKEIEENHLDRHDYESTDYSFYVVPSGIIIEALGWDTKTMHPSSYQGRSVEIALLGNFNDVNPSNEMIIALQRLIDYGVSIGKISHNYHVLAHRQIDKSINCPGDSLFNLMKSWPHWENV